MHYSHSLEHIVGSPYFGNPYSNVAYFFKNIDDNHDFNRESPIIFKIAYGRKIPTAQYKNQQNYLAAYTPSHSFTPEIFLNPSRQKARFVDDNDELKSIVEETFKLMMKDRLPANISITVLPFDEFKLLHSKFGPWSNGILGFSINGGNKQIFVRENHLDALLLVVGHEIGHVLTETLPNKHDEEAKAFAFSIGWAKTIKMHNVANLGLSIKDELDFQPARNGLHDVAFEFIDIMIRKGKEAIQLHNNLARKYISIFNAIYKF